MPRVPEHKSGVTVSTHSPYHLLRECIARKDLTRGRRVQQLLIQDGLQANEYLGTHIIRMFTLCGSLSEANEAFVRICTPSVYTWSVFLLAHASTGLAIQLYSHMLQTNVRPNAYCYAALLKACSNSASADTGMAAGMLLHNHITQDGFDLHAVINNSLIDMYVKLGDLTHALAVFKLSCVQSVVTWTTLISGYSSDGRTTDAFQLYQQMQQAGVDPNTVTFTSILKACSRVAAGRLVHFHVIERGLECDVFVANTLVDMYAELGSIEEARFVFDHLIGRDVVTWSAMIEGYAQEGQGKEVMWLFLQMQQEVEPNRVTLVNMVKACITSEFPSISRLIHGFVVEGGYDSDTLLGTALIDMYAKCGGFEDARVVFKVLPVRNVVTWTAMIAGYAAHGSDVEVALKYYADMQQEGIKPNEATFLSLLSACNHQGLVHKGYSLFDSMAIQGLEPSAEHYHCMLDLLGRIGCLNLASVVLCSIPVVESHVVGVRSLLSHCKTHGNFEISINVFNQAAREGWKGPLSLRFPLEYSTS